MQLSPRLERLRRWYVTTAVMLLNCLLAAAVFGALFVSVQKFRATLDAKARVSRVEKKYGDRVFEAYPDLNREEVRTLLWETWTRPCVFEAFTQFKERPFSGRFVNVSPHGFRHSAGQATWPPDANAFNVFVFGGSTAFGYGLPDTQTVASFLQGWLQSNGVARASVYNFGRAYYYSSQEIVLFMRLLMAGHVPHLALFLDGLNDSVYVDDLPALSDRLRDAMEGRKRAWFKRTKDRFGEETLGDASGEVAQQVVRRYSRNMRAAKALAESYRVQIAFIWQPVPTYKYDLQYHPFKGEQFKHHSNSRAVYELMDRERGKFMNDRSFIWCGDLQEGFAQAFYVDQVHYNAAFSRMLAESIGEGLQAQGLLKR